MEDFFLTTEDAGTRGGRLGNGLLGGGLAGGINDRGVATLRVRLLTLSPGLRLPFTESGGEGKVITFEEEGREDMEGQGVGWRIE